MDFFILKIAELSQSKI